MAVAGEEVRAARAKPLKLPHNRHNQFQPRTGCRKFRLILTSTDRTCSCSE